MKTLRLALNFLESNASGREKPSTAAVAMPEEQKPFAGEIDEVVFDTIDLFVTFARFFSKGNSRTILQTYVFVVMG